MDGRNSLLRKIKHLQEATFGVKDFIESPVKGRNFIVYCDPPYQGTTGYKSTGVFNHEKFWQRCREYSEHNLLLVSEYQAPEDFVEIAQFSTKTDMRLANGSNASRLEKIFSLRGSAFIKDLQ